MILRELYISDQVGCRFHDGLNIILGVGQNKRHAGHQGLAPSTHIPADQAFEPTAAGPPDDDLAGENASDLVSYKVSDTNGVGKTLLISVIKSVLGGDTETALSSSYFVKNRLWGTLSVEIDNHPLTVSRPLWSPLADDVFLVVETDGIEFRREIAKNNVDLTKVRSKIELQRLAHSELSDVMFFSKQEYQKYLAKRLNIDYSHSNITLSSLLDFIIRDEKAGFSDPISRIRRAQWIQYRSAQYLFGLPASTEQICAKYQEEIAQFNLELSAIREKLNSQGVTSAGKLENLRLVAESKLQKIRRDIELYRVTPSLETTRVEYQRVRTEYSSFASTLSKKQRYLAGYLNYRKDLKDKERTMSDLLKVDTFYRELLQYFPNEISKNINDFTTFFKELANDRDTYYADLITSIKSDIKFLKAEISRLEKEMLNFAQMLKNTSIVGDIAILTSTEASIKSELAHLVECHKSLLEKESLEDRIEEVTQRRKNQIALGKREERRFEQKRIDLISLFHELIDEIYGADDGELTFEYNSNHSSSTAGRTEIVCRIPSQNSHGRTYARINVFDFVWFLSPKQPGEFRPTFLIHDGSYSKISREVKSKMLHAVGKRLINQQYFVTINEDEIEMTPELEAAVCCRLDGTHAEGKFFHEQFD